MSSLTIFGLGCLIVFLVAPGVKAEEEKFEIFTPEQAFAPDKLELMKMRDTGGECIPIPKDNYRCGPSMDWCTKETQFGVKFCPDAKLVKCETKGKNTSCFCNGKGLPQPDFGQVLMLLEVCDKDWYTKWYAASKKG